MIAGDVVLLDFPFSELSGSKLRPAVVLAVIDRGDFVACQVATERHKDPNAIALKNADYAQGSLRINRVVRPGKLFTANRSIVKKRVAQLKSASKDRIRDAVIRILKSG